jgi:hypothetical protein
MHHHAPETSRVVSRCHATAHECKRRLSALFLLVWYRHELQKASHSICLFAGVCLCSVLCVLGVVCVCLCVCKQWHWTAQFSRHEKLLRAAWMSEIRYLFIRIRFLFWRTVKVLLLFSPQFFNYNKHKIYIYSQFFWAPSLIIIRGSNPGGGEIFRSCSDRPWGPPRLLYNRYRFFLGCKGGRGVTLTTHPHLVPRPWKSRAIHLLHLWARVACYRVKLYLWLTLPMT